VSIGLYKYYDDANREYQISLPDDFAVALSYEAADAADPYMPRSISPRYCAYWNESNNLYRAVVVPSKSDFLTPPQAVTVDSLVYVLSGFYGEQFQQLPGGNMVVLSGVQGEKGDSGVISATRVAPVADVPLSSIGADIELCRATNTPAGTYLVFGTVQFQTGAAAAEMTAKIAQSSGVSVQSASIYGATASRFYPVTIFCSLTFPTSSNILFLYGNSTVASAFARRMGDTGYLATQMVLLKL